MFCDNPFDANSPLYEVARPGYPPEMYAYLSQVCNGKERAWDCACGNGQAAWDLKEFFNEVHATDLSEQQIASRKRHPKIHYRVSSAEQACFSADSFDLVCVAQALHWFDFSKFWPEVVRVLKPGGVFCAWGYTWPVISTEIDSCFKTHLLDIIAPYWAPNNRMLWNHYKEVVFPFEQLDAPQFVMQVEWDLQEFLNFAYSFSATTKCIEAQGEVFFTKATSKLSQCWGEPWVKRVVGLEFVFYAGRVAG